MLITLSIVLIIISSLMGLVPKFRKFFQTRSEFFTFVLTLMATFIGVFWAIEFNNRNQENIDRDNVIKLLDAAKFEMENKVFSNRMYIEIIDNGLSGFNPKRFIKSNPIESSNLFQLTISNDLVLRKLSLDGVQELHNCMDNLNSMQKSINNDTTIADSLYSGLIKSFNKQLKYSIQVINLEIKVLDGEIDRKMISAEYDSLSTRYFRDEKYYDLDSALEYKNSNIK